MDKQKSTPFWVNEEDLMSPIEWFYKGGSFMSVCLVVWDNFKKLGKKETLTADEINVVNAMSATPYISAVAAELFMKGYLVSKGIKPKNLMIDFDHKIWDLRKACLKYGDLRFDNDNLVFLTDTYGPHLMSKGGIKYPDKRDVAVAYTEFERALIILVEITNDLRH